MAEYLEHISETVPPDASPNSLDCRIYNNTINGWLTSENYFMTTFSFEKFGPRVIMAEFSPAQCGWAENSVYSIECKGNSTFCDKSEVLQDSEGLGALESSLGLREGVLINVTSPETCGHDASCHQVSLIYDLSESISLMYVHYFEVLSICDLNLTTFFLYVQKF